MPDELVVQPETPAMKAWDAKDTGWMMNLFGTAIGAGVLYLPINAGAGGVWPLVVMALLVGPVVWLGHRNLVLFCLSSPEPSANITSTVGEHFGRKAGELLTVAYFVSIYPILLLYSIGITNVVINVIEYQMALVPPPRLLVSFVLVVSLVMLVHMGEIWMLLAVKLLCYLLVVALLGVSVCLIPYWNMDLFLQPVSAHDMLLTLLITTPLMIFSFNHAPACSAFARAYRMSVPDRFLCERKTSLIIKRNVQLLLFVTLFFVFSSVLTLSIEDLAWAREMNVPVLSVLASKSDNPGFSIMTQVIAFLAIASSFFGVYLGTLEGFQGLVFQHWRKCVGIQPLRRTTLKRLSVLVVVLTCWLAGYINWSVIGIVETVVVPVLAFILFVVPVIAFYRVPSLERFRNLPVDSFTVVVGVAAIIAFLFD